MNNLVVNNNLSSIEKVFNNIDLLQYIMKFCFNAERLNFHRINTTSKLLRINCFVCKKEPILPLMLFLFTKKYNHLNNYVCYECLFDYLIQIDHYDIKILDKYDKKLWEDIDKLNIKKYKNKINNQIVLKSYVKCEKCKIKCLNNIWLYNHKIKNCPFNIQIY